MCILVLALDAQEDFPVLLIFNRDEEFARRTTGLQCGADGVVCCTDEQAGGTWMAVGADGAVAALTNVRCLPPAHAAELQSRGALVRRVVAGDAAAVDSAAYANYNLLHGRLRLDAPSELLLSTSGPADLGGGAWRARTVAVRTPRTGAAVSPRRTTRAASSQPRSAGDSVAKGGVATGGGARCRRDGHRPRRRRATARGARPLMSTSGAARRDGGGRHRGGAQHAFTRAAENERRYQAAPFVQPFDLSGGFGDACGAPKWYGTVSQSALLLCRSERCVFYVYRTTARPPDGGDHGPWQWERVALGESPQEQDSAKAHV